MKFNQKIKKLLLCIFLTIPILMIAEISSIHAIGLSPSTSSVSPGGSFSITVSGLSNVRGKFSVSKVNATGLGEFFSNGPDSYTLSFIAGSSGVAQITISSVDAIYFDSEASVNWSQTVTVSVTTSNTGGGGGGTTPPNPTNPTNPTNPDGSANGNTDTPEEKPNDGKSSEASLASLKVSKGKLSPDFSETTTSYDLGLTSDITSIEIDAKAKDSKATVNGAGKHTVAIGKQDITISVTAENGSVKTYVIHVSVEEKPKDYVSYNDQKYGIITNVDDVIAPEGFAKTEVKLGGKKITGWYHASSKITLVYLADKDMVKNFYMVENGKVTSIYKPISILGKSLVVIDVPKELQTKKGMKYTTITVDNQKLKGWTFDNKSFANYYLIYIMDTNGKVKYYQYEKTEETLQLYSGAAPILASDYEANDQGDGNNLLTYGAIATSVILLGAVVYISLRNKKNVAYLMTQRRLNYMNQDEVPQETDKASENVEEE